MQDPVERGGVIRETRNFLAACVRYTSARFRLTAMEGKEAMGHAFKILAYILGSLALLIFAWFFLCLAGVFLLAKAFGGENGWIWASLVMFGVHVLVASLLALRAVTKAGLSRQLFPLTREELKKDQEWLETQTKQN
jgi:uncharacterized membrane protein YqjE